MCASSGIFNYTNLGPKWSDTISLDLEHSELLALVADKPLNFVPGQAYSYSNTGYFLLGMVIEKVSGMDYPAYLESEFQSPLGLTRTRYGSNVDLIPNRAQGYQYLGEGQFANDQILSMEQPYAAGSIIASAGDLVRWSLALVDGKVVTPETFEEMTTPFFLNNGEESQYGFGLQLDPYLGQRAFSHGGGINGFNSMMVYLPDSKICVAVISNSEGFRAQSVATGLVSDLLKEGTADKDETR